MLYTEDNNASTNMNDDAVQLHYLSWPLGFQTKNSPLCDSLYTHTHTNAQQDRPQIVIQ